MKHLSGKHDCFKYSFVMTSVLRVPCVLFGAGEVTNHWGKYTELKSFVTTPFQKYEKISDKIKYHLSTKYHSLAQAKAERFIPGLLNYVKEGSIYQYQIFRGPVAPTKSCRYNIIIWHDCIYIYRNPVNGYKY